MKKEMVAAKSIYFLKVIQEGEIQFGYIFLEKNGKFLKLNDLLIENEMAVECDKFEFETGKRIFRLFDTHNVRFDLYTVFFDNIFTEKIPLMIEYFRREMTFDQQVRIWNIFNTSYGSYILK